jgi:DNA-binding NtrC family response regulator
MGRKVDLNDQLIQKISDIKARHSFQTQTRQKIFVLDDDPAFNRILTKYFLSNTDHSIMTFTDEFSLLKFLTSEVPDVIIIDFHLKSFNGLKITEIIEQVFGIRVPIIMISGDKRLNEKVENRYKVFSKPLKLYNLVNYINNI